MKGSSIKNESHSLHISQNYKTELEFSTDLITIKYSELIIDYLKFILENIKSKKEHLKKYLIIRGLDTITNVFLNLLYFTKNLNLTYYHCQKSFYFYVEFICQISDDEKTFLQLTSRDASTYVYKKTLFDVKPLFRKTEQEPNPLFREKLNKINCFLNIYEMYLLKIINSANIDISHTNSIKLLTSKLNLIIDIYSTEQIIDKLYLKIDDPALFFDLNNLLLKKLNKSPDLILNIEKNIKLAEFDDKLKELPNKCIKWLVDN